MKKDWEIKKLKKVCKVMQVNVKYFVLYKKSGCFIKLF